MGLEFAREELEADFVDEAAPEFPQSAPEEDLVRGARAGGRRRFASLCARGYDPLVRGLEDADFAEIGALVAGCSAVTAAWVFGSVARGDATDASDLDVAVLLRTAATRSDENELHTIAGQLERFAPSGRVDVVILGAQGPVFRHRVLREGRLVLDRDAAARHDFEARTYVEYLDWKPTHDIAMASALSGLRRRFAGAVR